MAEKEVYFSKGQTVYSHLFPTGYGVVENILLNQAYPLHVRYQLSAGSKDVEYMSFDTNGRRDYSIQLSQKPLAPIENKPIATYGDMDLVWARDNDKELWICVYYCKYERERHYCYSSQALPKNNDLCFYEQVVPFDKRPF